MIMNLDENFSLFQVANLLEGHPDLMEEFNEFVARDKTGNI